MKRKVHGLNKQQHFTGKRLQLLQTLAKIKTDLRLTVGNMRDLRERALRYRSAQSISRAKGKGIKQKYCRQKT